MHREKITYYGSYEGLQEKKYLERLKFLISQNEESKYDVSFMLKNCSGGSPLDICTYALRTITFSDIAKLKKEERIIAIFDYDFKDEEFVKANEYCLKNNMVNAYTNDNFDLFLLLHRKSYNKQIYTNDGYKEALCKMFNLPPKSDIKDEKIIDKIMSQITLEDVINAIKMAKIICKKAENSGKEFNKLVGHYEQPYLRIHLFIEKVLIRCGIS